MYFKSIFIPFCILLLVEFGSTYDLIVGSSDSSVLEVETRIQAPAVPTKHAEEEHYFYVNPPSVIKRIEVLDLFHGEAEASIKHGGVGSTHVKLKMKSLKSHGLDYSIKIFS